MKFRLFGLALAALLFGFVAVAPAPAQAAKPGAHPVGFPISTAASNNTTFDGTLTISRFAVQNGQLVALGTITGKLTDAAGGVTPVAAQAVTVPVNGINGTSLAGGSATAAAVPNAAGTCNILTLNLGAIHLDVLGLVVDLSPVNLVIDAQSGPGNLLGNLLCAVVNLLNGGSPLTGLANLLNQILALL